MKKIPYNKQYIDSKDIELVSTALKGKLITTGKFVESFENKITKLLKCKYAISCSSGTAAIHLALLSIGIKKNDVVIMINHWYYFQTNKLLILFRKTT